jgi:N-acetylglutamate synthase-like GNAT family acetyltransferase
LLFDENCPESFAPNERSDYESFLDEVPDGYELCISSEVVIAAYGLIGKDSTHRSLNWIMISPRFQGAGLGSVIMNQVKKLANKESLSTINIAASHLSQRFFKKYGAKIVKEQPNGWGPGMHRIDMVLNL